MNIQTLVQTLKNSGCRMTPQRQVILEVLISHQDKMQTVESLLIECQQKNPEINTTTVYRNLELLDHHHLLYKMNLDRHTTGYKLICMDHHHHHIICKGCGVMEAIDYCPISPELLSMTDSKGFLITEHSLELFGFCEKCKHDRNKQQIEHHGDCNADGND